MRAEHVVHREALQVIGGQLGGHDARRAIGQPDTGTRRRRGARASRRARAAQGAHARRGQRSARRQRVRAERRRRRAAHRSRSAADAHSSRSAALACLNQLADSALGGHAGVARRADAQVVLDARALGRRQLAVDVRRDERVEFLTGFVIFSHQSSVISRKCISHQSAVISLHVVRSRVRGLQSSVCSPQHGPCHFLSATPATDWRAATADRPTDAED